MRLWHIDLLPKLPRQQLLGQHRECCALRGAGWGKKHSVVDYVFDHPYICLYKYHMLVIYEMVNRGYKVNPLWYDRAYRGEKVGHDYSDFTMNFSMQYYPEHNAAYLAECVANLAGKGIAIEGVDHGNQTH